MLITEFIPGKLSWVCLTFSYLAIQNKKVIQDLSWDLTLIGKFFILFHLVLSLTFKAKPHSALQVEGRPFELVCYIKGTPDEIKDHKILWEGHDINEDKIIPIKGNDNNGIITVDKSEILSFLFNCCII